ncbi:MAG: DMT family transporter [Clostridiaceae bacterium]
MAFGLILSFVSGCIGVFSKMINFKLSEKLGFLNGSLVNFVVASIVSIIAIIISRSYNLISFETLNKIPFWIFWGGIFGLIAFLLTIYTLPTIPVVYSTIIILAAQLGSGFIIDVLIKGDFSVFKLLGLILVIIGIALDKFLMIYWKNNAENTEDKLQQVTVEDMEF